MDITQEVAAAMAADREAATAKRLTEIQAEADRQKAEVERQNEMNRNGGYSDAFGEWAREFLAAADRKHEQDDNTARIMAGVESALKNE